MRSLAKLHRGLAVHDEIAQVGRVLNLNRFQRARRDIRQRRRRRRLSERGAAQHDLAKQSHAERHQAAADPPKQKPIPAPRGAR